MLQRIQKNENDLLIRLRCWNGNNNINDKMSWIIHMPHKEMSEAMLVFCQWASVVATIRVIYCEKKI